MLLRVAALYKNSRVRRASDYPLYGSKIHLENHLHANHGFDVSDPESICYRGRYVLSFRGIFRV